MLPVLLVLEFNWCEFSDRPQPLETEEKMMYMRLVHLLGCRAKHAVIMRFHPPRASGVSRIFLTPSPRLPLLASTKISLGAPSLLWEEGGSP